MLTERLAELGAEAIVEALRRLESLNPRPQSVTGVTYATKIRKSEAHLNWKAPAIEIERRIRALNPTPGAETRLGEEPLKVWASELASGEGPSGTVIRHDRGCPVVACGLGALALTSIQRPGSRRMAAAEFQKARAIPVGTILNHDGSG
jgi:methionyl-tRNA formyltransferase